MTPLQTLMSNVQSQRWQRAELAIRSTCVYVCVCSRTLSSNMIPIHLCARNGFPNQDLFPFVKRSFNLDGYFFLEKAGGYVFHSVLLGISGHRRMTRWGAACCSENWLNSRLPGEVYGRKTMKSRCSNGTTEHCLWASSAGCKWECSLGVEGFSGPPRLE